MDRVTEPPRRGVALRDIGGLLKPGIVASNTLTALSGFVLAALRARIAPAEALPLALLAFAGVATIVAGSCAVNNWIDRDIDALMERTRSRPTASGRAGAALSLGLGFSLVAAGALLLATASAAAALAALGGAFVYLVPYSLWIKRRSAASVLVGGLAGAVPPLVGWAIVDPGLGGPAWALFLLLVVWQQAHVRALALSRESEYRGAGLPMAGLGGSGSRGSGFAARAGILACIACLLPFPFLLAEEAPLAAPAGLVAALAWMALGVPGIKGRPGIPGIPGKRAVPGAQGPAWGRRMFLGSLGYLATLFGSLAVAGILG